MIHHHAITCYLYCLRVPFPQMEWALNYLIAEYFRSPQNLLRLEWRNFWSLDSSPTPFLSIYLLCTFTIRSFQDYTIYTHSYTNIHQQNHTESDVMSQIVKSNCTGRMRSYLEAGCRLHCQNISNINQHELYSLASDKKFLILARNG